MARITVHVIPIADGWVVAEHGQHVGTYRGRRPAEQFARQEALRAHGDLVVRGQDGRVEWKRSYAVGSAPDDQTDA
jgi:hypothetical protein